MKKRPLSGHGENASEFQKLLSANSGRHRRSEVFRDFCEMSALSLSNAVDLRQREAREERYMQIVRRYEKDEIGRFPAMLALVVQELEAGMCDCLGDWFMKLDLGDAGRGQFFTPYSVSSMTARLLSGDLREQVEEKGFITVDEPTAGAGGMVIAMAETMQEQNINYQAHMHARATDIDATAVHMTYVQLSLLHIPALVIHGNSLWPKDDDEVWYTPAHILGGWSRKLRARAVGLQPVSEMPASSIEALQGVAPKTDVHAAESVLNEAPRGQMALF